MLKYSPNTDDGRSRLGYLYIFISDYKNDPPPPSPQFKLGKINLHRCKYFKTNIQIGIKPAYCSHYTQVLYKFSLYTSTIFIQDEVLLTVSCPIFPSIFIAKNLLTGSLKNRSIDNLETQKKSISMKNSQFFDYLLYAKSK